MKKCVCCEKTFDQKQKKLYFDLGSVDLFDDVLCKECGQIIGVKNWFSAQFSSTKSVLKKYRKVKPEERERIDIRLKALKERNIQARRELREEFFEAAESKSKRSGCREKVQEKYTCINCKNTWYVGDMDKVRNVYNATTNTYTLSKVRDFSQCPQCGSSASTHKTVKYWIDKKGNCVDIEE